MKRTISVMVGKGSVSHNSRKFHAANTDPERSNLNRCFCDTPIKEVYHQLFSGAIQRYNARQKRSDRCIDDYFEKIRSGKQEKLFHEVILQIGNREDTHAESEEGAQAAALLEEYARDFQSRNPNLYVFSAHLHMDEATPHIHIDFVPYTTGSTRGLDTRVSLKQALAAQGFVGGSRSDTEWNQWVRSEKEQLAEIMERQGIEWEQKDTHHEHLSVLDFKKQERSREVEQLQKTAVEIKSEVESLQAKVSTGKDELKDLTVKKSKVKEVDAVVAKPALLDSNKVVVTKDEFDDLKTLAKKQIVSERKEKILTKSNRDLATENTTLRKELHEYKSVKNQLTVSKLEAKVSQLQRLVDRIMEFVEKLGLKPQLDKFLKSHVDKER